MARGRAGSNRAPHWSRRTVCAALPLCLGAFGAPLRADDHIGGGAAPPDNANPPAFHAVIDGKAVGPLTDGAGLQALIDDDRIHPSTLVWWDRQPDWIALKKAKPLEPVLKAVYVRQGARAKAFLPGVWDSGTTFTINEGLGQVRGQIVLTFGPDRSYTYFQRISGESMTSVIDETRTGAGDYTAWLEEDGGLLVHLKGETKKFIAHGKKREETEKADEWIDFDVVDRDTLRWRDLNVLFTRSR